MNIGYQNVLTKNVIDEWSVDRGLIASELISMHLEERFDVSRILVDQAENRGDFLSLKISTDKWSEPRDFVLMSTGSLAWSSL